MQVTKKQFKIFYGFEYVNEFNDYKKHFSGKNIELAMVIPDFNIKKETVIKLLKYYE